MPVARPRQRQNISAGHSSECRGRGLLCSQEEGRGRGRNRALSTAEHRCWWAASGSTGYFCACLRTTQAGPRGGTGLVHHIRRAQPPTNPPNGGLFHATAATKPGCAGAGHGAGSGERHDETKNALLKHPNTSLSTARPPGGVHRHTTTPRQRGGRHATGPVSAHRRDGTFRTRGPGFRAPIYERDVLAPVLYRSSFVVVSGQW